MNSPDASGLLFIAGLLFLVALWLGRRGGPLGLAWAVVVTIPLRIMVALLRSRPGRAALFVVFACFGVVLFAEDPAGMVALALSPAGLVTMVVLALLLGRGRRGGRARRGGWGAAPTAAGRPAPFSVGALGGRAVRAGRNVRYNARVLRGYGGEVAEGVRERLPWRRRAAAVYLSAGAWVESNRPFWRAARAAEGLREDVGRRGRVPAVPQVGGGPAALGGRVVGYRGDEGAAPPAPPYGGGPGPVALGGRVRLPQDLREPEPETPRVVAAGRGHGWRGWGG